MSVEIRPMAISDIESIGDVERSETVNALYLAEPSPDGLGLVLRRVGQDPPLRVPPWDLKGVQRRTARWKRELEAGGVMLGALDGGELVGFAIMGPSQPNRTAELCALFVDAAFRRSGVASRLVDEIEKFAGFRGVSTLFIYSNETESSVEFYVNRGCRIIGLVDKTLVDQLPGDVIFAKTVAGVGEASE